MLFIDGAYAQQPASTDSLKRAITTAKHDTARLVAMMALSERIGQQRPDTNLVLCESALAIADRALKQPGIKPVVRKTLLVQQASALNNKAVSHFMFGELDSALICFKQAEVIHRSNGRADGVADALNNQGVVHEKLGNHAEQRRCLFEALVVYQKAGESYHVATALNNIGNYFKARGLSDSAHAYLDSSLSVAQRLNDQRAIANSLLNVGLLHAEQGQASEALERYLECERIYTQ
ncbi:MAG: tetratricopeptide repeat protein [Flavobacteriales bacterium]|nr:tetratricopeptide repeat protein [Flavobacteriales bacterium]